MSVGCGNHMEAWSFDPSRASIPIPGTTSGMMASGTNFNKVPQGTLVMAWTRQPPPSPLQQWFGGSDKPTLPSAYQVGMPVRICHLLSPEVRQYNNMVGDIYEVDAVQNDDGTQDLLFEVRCPVSVSSLANLVDEQESYKKPFSPPSQAAAAANRALLVGAYGASGNSGEGSRLPPFVLLSRLGSEKLEPLNNAASMSLSVARAGTFAAAMGGMARVPAETSQTALILQPKWGPPMPAVADPELPPRDFEPKDEIAYASVIASSRSPMQPTNAFSAVAQQAPMEASARYSAIGTAPSYQPPQISQPVQLPALAPAPVWDGPPTPPLSSANGATVGLGAQRVHVSSVTPCAEKPLEQLPRAMSNVSTNLAPETSSFYAYQSHLLDPNRGSAMFSQGSTAIAPGPGRTTSFYSEMRVP